jgi:hypothetical protein
MAVKSRRRAVCALALGADLPDRAGYVPALVPDAVLGPLGWSYRPAAGLLRLVSGPYRGPAPRFRGVILALCAVMVPIRPAVLA